MDSKHDFGNSPELGIPTGTPPSEWAESTHTPMPWRIVESATTTYIVGPDGNGQEIAEVYRTGPGRARHIKADVRLMRSAPEMLAALNLVKKFFDTQARSGKALPSELTHAVITAIAKARA